jgi:hypothetical protein
LSQCIYSELSRFVWKSGILKSTWLIIF